MCWVIAGGGGRLLTPVGSTSASPTSELTIRINITRTIEITKNMSAIFMNPPSLDFLQSSSLFFQFNAFGKGHILPFRLCFTSIVCVLLSFFSHFLEHFDHVTKQS